MKQETLSSYVQHVKEEKSWQYVTVLAVIEFSVINTKRLILIAGCFMGTDKDFRISDLYPWVCICSESRNGQLQKDL